MEAKKSDKANLENKKGLFFELGLVIALAIVLFAFEWKSYDKQEEVAVLTEASMEVEEMVIQTQQDEPEPEQQEVEQQSTTEFEIVDDDVELTNKLDMSNFENTTNTGIVNTKVEVQHTEEVEDDTERTIFKVVEQQAEFPGGMQALYKYLAENIKYPQQARETGTSGKVFVTFVVEKDGSLTDIKILRDIGSGCGDEAVRVVKSMPKWQPAKQRGKVVRQQFNLPINFTLQ